MVGGGNCSGRGEEATAGPVVKEPFIIIELLVSATSTVSKFARRVVIVAILRAWRFYVLTARQTRRQNLARERKRFRRERAREILARERRQANRRA